MSKHILVVEDDDTISMVLRRWFVSDGFQVTQLCDGRRIDELLATQAVDLVVMDISLPDTDGFRLITGIRRKYDTAIIIVSGRSDLMDRIAGLEMGADDYITKPFEPREVLARARSVLRRAHNSRAPAQAVPGVSAILSFDGWVVDQSARSLFSPGGMQIALTSGEYQLLEAFVTHANRVLSRDQLIELTSSNDSPAFDRSIDTRIGRLRRKLNDHPREPRYIKTVRNGGYMFASRVERRDSAHFPAAAEPAEAPRKYA